MPNLRVITLVSLGFLLVSVPRGDAQILNTLRGFDEEAPGWSGRVAGAVDLADGNTQYLELSLGASVQLQTPRQRWRLMGNASRKTSGGVETAESRLGHLRHNYRVLGPVSTVAFIQGQHDPFKDLETRILVGVGGQVDLTQGPVLFTRVGLTVMREDEKLTDAGSYETTARLSSFFSLIWEPGEGSRVDISAFYQPSLEDLGDARNMTSVTFEFDVVGDLFFNSSYLLEFDSDPPPGVKEADHRLKSGVGYRL